MTNEELLKIIDQVRGGTRTPTTKIDQIIPLPTGSKTMIGFLGALVTGAFSVVSSNPSLMEFTQADWKSSLATVLALAFTTLMGAGGIAKWQRQILISQQVLDVLQQGLKKSTQQTDV